MSDTPKSVLHAPTLALRRLAQTAAPLIRQVAAPASNNSNMQQQTRLYGNGVNVLVYTGPGTSKFAVENTILTLKTVLKDQYDVMRVDAKALLNEPWQVGCSGHLWNRTEIVPHTVKPHFHASVSLVPGNRGHGCHSWWS